MFNQSCMTGHMQGGTSQFLNRPDYNAPTLLRFHNSRLCVSPLWNFGGRIESVPFISSSNVYLLHITFQIYFAKKVKLRDLVVSAIH